MNTTILEHITREATRLAQEEAEAFRRKLHAFLTDCYRSTNVDMLQYSTIRSLWIKPDMAMATGHHEHSPRDVKDYAWGTALVHQVRITAKARHEKRLTDHILSSLPPAPPPAPEPALRKVAA